MMRIDPDKPGLRGLLRGEGELSMRILAWGGVCVIFPLNIAAVLSVAL
jgi:hypothetical protein